jgi:hypothetical protein
MKHFLSAGGAPESLAASRKRTGADRFWSDSNASSLPGFTVFLPSLIPVLLYQSKLQP